MSASHIVEAGECLVCGHRLPFAIYRPKAGEASVGICAECARLAAPNRGRQMDPGPTRRCISDSQASRRLWAYSETTPGACSALR